MKKLENIILNSEKIISINKKIESIDIQISQLTKQFDNERHQHYLSIAGDQGCTSYGYDIKDIDKDIIKGLIKFLIKLRKNFKKK